MLSIIKSLGCRKDKSGKPQAWVLAECSYCKQIVEKRRSNISLDSCGCQKSIKLSLQKTKHGQAGKYARPDTVSSLYRRWAKMKKRCISPSPKDYAAYAGKGINICEEWHKFEPFAKWASENGYAEHLEIDRIDNSKGYCPENCRWVTPLENLRHKSRSTMSMEKAQAMRADFENGASHKNLMAKYAESKDVVSQVISGKTWYLSGQKGCRTLAVPIAV